MSKIRRISGQATGLGIASLLTLGVWSSIAHTQEPASGDQAAPNKATTTTQAVPTKATKGPGDLPPGAKAKDGKGPGGPHRAGGPEGRAHGDEGKGPKADGKKDADKPGALRPAKGPVSRSEAIEHYRTAQKALTEVPEPTDPKSEAAAEARKARRDALRELRRARDEILRSHNDARRDFQKRNPDDVEQLRKKVTDRTSEMRKDRKDRAKKSREELQKLVGDKPLHPSVKEELRSHAWRLARLNQLIYLAELDNKPKLAEKAKELVGKENGAHDERLKKLLAQPEVKNYKPPAPSAASKDKAGSKLPPNHPLVPGATPKAPAKPAGEAQ